MLDLVRLTLNTKKMSLLLVNDEIETLKLQESLFSNFFKDISVAQLPSVAIKRLNEQTFDFLITDNHMPEMYGIDLIKKIRDGEVVTNESLRKSITNIPILMITGENSTNAEKRFDSFFSNYPRCTFLMMEKDITDLLYKKLSSLINECIKA